AQVHGDLDRLIELRLGVRLDHLHGLDEGIGLVAIDAFRRRLVALAPHGLPHHFQAHRAGRTRHLGHRRLDRIAVEVGHLLLRDLLDLLLGHLADDLRADRLGARFDACGLLQEVAHRRGLGDESEAAILEHGDDHRNRHARFHLLGARVELLAEFHDVDALLTERGPDRRRRIGLARWYPQLYEGLYLFGHACPFLLGGVVRPWPASHTLCLAKSLIPKGFWIEPSAREKAGTRPASQGRAIYQIRAGATSPHIGRFWRFSTGSRK